MKKSKSQKTSAPKGARTKGIPSRPRGRPRQIAVHPLHHEDAEAIRSLRNKMLQLDDNISKLNLLIQEELAERRLISQSDDEDRKITSANRSTTLVASEVQSVKSEPDLENDDRPIPLIDTSLHAAAAPIEGALIERFVDSYGSPTATSTESKFWIHDGRPWLLWRYGAEEAAFSPLLNSAYLAVSAAYAGLSLNDPHLTRAGAQGYQCVLKSLQNALKDPEMSKSDAVLMTVGLCMNYEGRLSRDAKAGYSVHVVGMLRLCEYRGPYLHRTGLAHYFFVDVRIYMTWGAILSRRPTFLSTSEWKTVPWSLGTTDKDLSHHLYDEMLEIPRMLWCLDQYESSTDNSRKIELRDAALGVATNIRQGLEGWKSRWLDRAIWRRPYEKPLNQLDPNLPVFRHPGTSDPSILVEPDALVYPNGALFGAVCNYYAAMIIILNTLVRLDEYDQKDQTERFVAYEICRSLVYFLVYLPRSMLGRVSFAIATAYHVLPEGGIEREFIKDFYYHCSGGTWRRFDDFSHEFSALGKGLRRQGSSD